MKKKSTPAKPPEQVQQKPDDQTQFGGDDLLENLDDLPIVGETENPGVFAESVLAGEDVDPAEDDLINAAIVSEEDFANSLDEGKDQTDQSTGAQEDDYSDESAFPAIDGEPDSTSEGVLYGQAESDPDLDALQSEIFGDQADDQVESSAAAQAQEILDDYVESTEVTTPNDQNSDLNASDMDHDPISEHQESGEFAAYTEDSVEEETQYGSEQLSINDPDELVDENGEIITLDHHDHAEIAGMHTRDEYGSRLDEPYEELAGAAATAKAYASSDEDEKKGFVAKQIESIKKDPIVLGAIVVALIGATWWFTMGRSSGPSAPTQRSAPQVEMVEVQPTQNEPAAPIDEMAPQPLPDYASDSMPDQSYETAQTGMMDQAPMSEPMSGATPEPMTGSPENTAGAQAMSGDATYTAAQMKDLEAAIVADFTAKLAEKDAEIAKLQAQGGGGGEVSTAKLQATQREVSRYKNLYEKERKESAQNRAYAEQLYRELVIAANGGQSEVVAKLKSGELRAPEPRKEVASSTSSRSSGSTVSSAQRASQLGQSNPGSITVKAVTPTVAVLSVQGQDVYVRVGTTINGITVKNIDTVKNTVDTNIGTLRF